MNPHSPAPRDPNRDDPPPTVRVPEPFLTMAVRGPDDTPPPRNRPLSARLADAVESGTATPPPLPRLGDELFGFTLVEELGAGSFGRVYLARQAKLSDRLVALKVTHRPTREPQKLARLQHSNIVPVYDVFEDAGRQVICMPFVGRRTLAHLLGDFRREHPSRRYPGRRSGATLKPGSTAVHFGGAFGKPNSAVGRPAAPTGESVPLVGNVPAVLKALAGLASGLAHAHGRDILHLDIKTANVLFADTGDLMLLDFNLSYDTRSARREMVGGTIQYMAPEQLTDIRTGGNGAVDARTDLYGLGILAYELLTGSVPFPFDGLLSSFDDLMDERRKPVAPASRVNPAIPPAVDAILAKLLDAEPSRRYQTADDLCEDLRRQTADEPLKFAPNPSLAERATKWKRRNPGALWKLATAATVVVAAAAAFAYDRQQGARATADAAVQFRDARANLGTLRLDLILADDPRATARGHASANEFLKKYGLPDDAEWRKRASFARLPAESRAVLAEDLGEVLLLRAHATWRGGKAQPDAARLDAAAEALKLNRLAETCFAADAVPPFVLAQRAELLAAKGEPAEAGEVAKPRTPREFFLAAVGELAAHRHNAAAALLESAVAGQPDHAAAQMLLAACRHQQGLYGGAVERYDAARVLMPTDPRAFFFRGIALGTSGKQAQAVEEFTKALDLDPEYREAYRNRAIAYFRTGKLAEAERDLTRGLELDGPVFQFYQMRAKVRGERKDAAGAAADLKAIADTKPESEMDYLVRAWSRGEDETEAALADYREAEKRNPRSVLALQNQAGLLADKLGRPKEALDALARLKSLYPNFAPGLAARAVVLARLGHEKDAKAEAQRAQTLSGDAAVTYRLACVYALTAKATPGDRAEAMKFLRKAFRDGYPVLKECEKDADLASVRGTTEFAEFLKAAREVAR